MENDGLINVKNAKDLNNLIGLKKEKSEMQKIINAMSSNGISESLAIVSGVVGSGKSEILASTCKALAEIGLDVTAVELSQRHFVRGNHWDIIENWFTGLGSEAGSVLWLDEAHEICARAKPDAQTATLLPILRALCENETQSGVSHEKLGNGDVFKVMGSKDIIFLSSNYADHFPSYIVSRAKVANMSLTRYTNAECVAIFEIISKARKFELESVNVAKICGNAVRGNARTLKSIATKIEISLAGKEKLVDENTMRNACKLSKCYPYGVSDLGIELLQKLAIRPVKSDSFRVINTQFSKEEHVAEELFLRNIEIGNEKNGLTNKVGSTYTITKTGLNYIDNITKKGWL